MIAVLERLDFFLFHRIFEPFAGAADRWLHVSNWRLARWTIITAWLGMVFAAVITIIDVADWPTGLVLVFLATVNGRTVLAHFLNLKACERAMARQPTAMPAGAFVYHLLMARVLVFVFVVGLAAIQLPALILNNKGDLKLALVGMMGSGLLYAAMFYIAAAQWPKKPRFSWSELLEPKGLPDAI